MRYVMKQKMFGIGGDFIIKDENQQDRYLVDGKVFTIGKKFIFKDMQGDELGRIQQKLFALRKTFHIYRSKELIATVSKNLFSLFKTKFRIDVPGPEDIDVTGNFFAHEYAFTRNGQQIATVSKQFFSWTDTYGIDIGEGEDDILILSAAVIIDTCCHEAKAKSASSGSSERGASRREE
jgi:uncharacterized protein YxjI